MSEIKELTLDLSASIWMRPATFEELYNRKIQSLKHMDEYSFFQIINIAKSKKWIYLKNDIYYCYKKTVKNILNAAGYNLDPASNIKYDYRKDFDELYNKLNNIKMEDELIGTTGPIVDKLNENLTQEEWNALCVIHRMTNRLNMRVQFSYENSIDAGTDLCSQIIDESVFLNKESSNLKWTILKLE